MGVTAEITAVAVGIGVLGAVVGILVARRPKASASSIIVWSAIAVAAASMVGAVFVLATVPLAHFAVAHLLYLVAVVALPIVGLGWAAAWWRQRDRRPLAIGAVLLLLLVPFGVWATHVAPFRLREDRATLVLAPGRSIEQPLRIGVLSDLQNIGITGYEQTAVDRLMAQKPDVILIAGDLFQGNEDQFRATLPAYRELLGRLDAPGGVFLVRGDVDGESIVLLIEGTDIVLLDDEVTSTTVEGQRIVIGGVRLDYASPAAQRVYDDLEATTGEDPVLLLSHRPDSVRELPADSRVDLTVAGHTHGGQIAIPFFGPPVTLSGVPRSVGAGGLHEISGNAIYVSTGVGLERGRAPQIRLFTRPSFGIIEVTPSAR